MRKIKLLAAVAAIAVTAFVVNTSSRAQTYGPGMMGGYGYGQGYGPGYGMMGGGYGPGYGPGMMGGYGGGYGMMGPGYGYGPGMMGPGYGYGMMGPGYGGGYGGQGYGPGMMGGYGPGYNRGQGNLNLSADDVKNYLERTIRNPNLKVGEVKEKDADTITAEIVTKDKGGVVQRFQVDRHNGFYRPEGAQ